MDKLIDWIKNKTDQVLVIPTGMVGSQFIFELLMSLRDGHIDDGEWHQLVNGANGVEFLSLTFITFVLRYMRKNNS